VGIPYGVLRADDRVVREIEEALRIAKRAGDDLALSFICTVAGTLSSVTSGPQT